MSSALPNGYGRNNLPVPSFPSLYASVISVASQEDLDPLHFCYNPAPPVEFSAPGIDVRVAWSGGGYMNTTGNSFAAPHIAFQSDDHRRHAHVQMCVREGLIRLRRKTVDVAGDDGLAGDVGDLPRPPRNLRVRPDGHNAIATNSDIGFDGRRARSVVNSAAFDQYIEAGRLRLPAQGVRE